MVARGGEFEGTRANGATHRFFSFASSTISQFYSFSRDFDTSTSSNGRTLLKRNEKRKEKRGKSGRMRAKSGGDS